MFQSYDQIFATNFLILSLRNRLIAKSHLNIFGVDFITVLQKKNKCDKISNCVCKHMLHPQRGVISNPANLELERDWYLDELKFYQK